MNMSYTDSERQWPYPVDYGKENELAADVLVLGGGVAGCHAAIVAARTGASVVLVEKGSTVRSGSGGPGVDHWHGACTNPCSKVTPLEMMDMVMSHGKGYHTPEFGNGITSYILLKESYDTLMDVEKMGVKVRDVDDEFVGAEFRDEETKLLFAYDYKNRFCIRVNGGTDIKVALYKELKRLGVTICDRVMATSLLNEGGKAGGRVIGATGLHTRTGEFYIFKAKSTIISTSGPTGLWIFSGEMAGATTHCDPNNVGEGTAMAWQAGAELTLLERSTPGTAAGGFTFPAYGTGNAHNTWYACSIVDANGKEVPWVDRDGNVLKTVEERYYPAPGQKAFLSVTNLPYETRGPGLIPQLPKLVADGEFVLPLYADLPGMPPYERRVIWGLMLYHEAKGRIIYDTYQRAGFDPDKDMLQVNIMPPEKHFFWPWWAGHGPRQWREGGFVPGSGILFDWNLKTTVDGLYVAGQANYAGGNHAMSATTGRYAARNAAAYARTAAPCAVSREQIDAEKERVYAPVTREKGIGWKELRAGLCRVMQDYCGEFRSQEILETGLRWLQSIKESEAANVCARNPHELWRTVECFTRMTVGEIMMHASLERKASSMPLQFKRLDYPDMDPAEWNKLITLKQQEHGKIIVAERPLNYHLQPPFSSDYEENYYKYSGL